MKRLLLVLTHIQNAKARSTVRLVLEGAGHRVIEAAGFAQVNSLLSNGLDPDLLLCEAPYGNASETSQFRHCQEFIPSKKICLISKLSGQRLRTEAAELDIQYALAMPLTREDVESVIETIVPLKGRATAAS